MRRSRISLLVGLLLMFGAWNVASAQDAVGQPAPLAPCEPGGTAPCVLRAEEPADIVGIWKQYVGNPALNAPDGMGYIQYRSDGTYSLADTSEATSAAKPPFPSGTYTFENGILTINVDGEMAPMVTLGTM